MIEARERVAQDAGPTPVLLKIAPDLSLAELDDVVGVARPRRVDGMIVGNTTVARPASLRETARAKEAGGLSGRPLFPLATRMLAETYVRVESVFPLIGVGGIDSGTPRSPNSAPARASFSFIPRWCSAGWAFSPRSKPRSSPLSNATGWRVSSSYVGADAAAVTAEPWPR